MKNRIIVVEGMDSSGKTSIAIPTISNYLEEQDIPKNLICVLPNQSDHKLAQTVKMIKGSEPESAEASFYLMYSYHIQLIHLIKKRYKQGYWVIVDRFIPSLIAYQVAHLSAIHGKQARATVVANKLSNDLESYKKIDLIIHLEITVTECLSRLSKKTNKDIIESRDYSYFKQVSDCYKLQFDPHDRGTHINGSFLNLDCRQPTMTPIKMKKILIKLLDKWFNFLKRQEVIF